MRAVNNEYDNDEEYRAFEDYVDSSNKAAATAKSYRTTYRKLRKLLNKPIRDAAQDTVINVVSSAVENINSQQALLNIAIVVRAECFQMPTDLLVEQRTKNKTTVIETCKMNNQFIVLPTLDEFDQFLESLWERNKWKEYIINYLIRHHYVRNQDLIFDVVESKKDVDSDKNWIWLDRRKQRAVYIRNVYKTHHVYGPKEIVIDNERFLKALKMTHKSRSVWPLADEDPTKIGYYIQKMSFNRLGEGLCLKIIVNHYKGDISKLKEISKDRGTDVNTLLTCYNVSYTD